MAQYLTLPGNQATKVTCWCPPPQATRAINPQGACLCAETSSLGVGDRFLGNWRRCDGGSSTRLRVYLVCVSGRSAHGGSLQMLLTSASCVCAYSDKAECDEVWMCDTLLH